MRINGYLPRSADLYDVIAQLNEGPSPFNADGVMPTVAHGVHQGQWGLSANEPLGTKHVGECVALIAKDSAGRVAVAHIDQFNSTQSVEGLLDSLYAPLEVILLGAKFAPDSTHKDASPERKDASKYNLQRTIDLLRTRDVNVIGARVQDDTQPSTIYVNPRSMSVHQRGNEHEDPHFALAYAKMILSGQRDSIALENAFDLTKDPKRNPILLRKAEVEILNTQVNGKPREHTFAWFASQPKFKYEPGGDPAWINTCVDLAQNWNKLYQAELNATAKALEIPPETIRHKAMFIGANARSANITLQKPNAALLQAAPKSQIKPKN